MDMTCHKPTRPKCLSGNISERKLAFSGCEQSLVPEGDLSRWRLRRLKNPMISRSGFRTDTQASQRLALIRGEGAQRIPLVARHEAPRSTRIASQLYQTPQQMTH